MLIRNAKNSSEYEEAKKIIDWIFIKRNAMAADGETACVKLMDVAMKYMNRMFRKPI